MTTKTGDKTKAQIMADSNIDKRILNKYLNDNALKAIKTANEFAATTSSDWVGTPASQDAALDELAGRVKVIEGDSVNIDELVTLTGVAAGSEDLGDFSGATITSDGTIKEALQELETAVEGAASAASDAQADVDDLVTLSGVAVNAEHLGTFTGSTIPDSQTIKQALQALESAFEGDTLRLEASGTISSEEILALNATPKTLIAAPGAGKLIVVDQIELFLDYGTAAYVADAGEDFTIEYAGGVDIAALDNDSDTMLTGTADARRLIRPVIYDKAASSFDAASADNEAVQASIAVGEVITGDSVIKWKIRYHIETLLV